MDKLVAELLVIERAGNESLAELDSEIAANSRQIETEIARQLQEIKHKTGLAVEAFKQDAEAALIADIANIETERRQKAAQLQELFAKNAAQWRKELVDRVLYIPTP